ncbi:hypothetical protein CFAM422_010611 [Trichoderma lentiforme]|uniref:Uncharacterized protein n=1 Tax=Trichoderma lentiforme TaxID=1567552 RepID=A0A9P4X7U9_9HYPO|nr:hypothetical protein CFAM422_010611 [Trichoderma lentiforme]
MRYELTRGQIAGNKGGGWRQRGQGSEREPEGGGQEKAMRAICVLCVTRTSPRSLAPPLVVDAPYSMITITYVKTRRWRGGSSADRSNENWLARAGHRTCTVTFNTSHRCVACLYDTVLKEKSQPACEVQAHQDLGG